MSLYEYLRALLESLAVVSSRLEVCGGGPALDLVDAIEGLRDAIGAVLQKVPPEFAREVEPSEGYLW